MGGIDKIKEYLKNPDGTNLFYSEFRFDFDSIKSQEEDEILKKFSINHLNLIRNEDFLENYKDIWSDVDILIQIDRGTDLIELIRLKTKLQKIIKRKVDLVEYASIRKELKASILNDQIPLL